jgi:hypothetical protein
MVGPVSLPLSFGNGEVFPHRSLPLVGQQVKGVVSAPILASVTLHSNNCVPISPCSMPERGADPMDQARRDLAMAGDTGFLEWGCFILEQAAEKAIVAVYQRLGAVRVGSFSISSKVSGQPAGRSLPTSFQSHAVSTACISRHATQTGFPGGSRPTTSSGRMQTMQSVVRKESFGSVTVFWLDTDLVHERRWRGWRPIRTSPVSSSSGRLPKEGPFPGAILIS